MDVVKIKIESRFEVEIDEDTYLRNTTMFGILLDELFQKTSKQHPNIFPFNPLGLDQAAAAPSKPMTDEEFEAWRLDTRVRRNKRRVELGLPLLPLRDTEPAVQLEPEDDNDPSRLLRQAVDRPFRDPLNDPAFRPRRSSKKVVRKTRRRGTV